MEPNKLLLSELYAAYFNRAPDADGLSYWLNELDTGVIDFNSIASNWASEQTEFTDTYGTNIDNTAFITQVYSNVLGRDPDSDGAAYWNAELSNGNIPMDQFIQAVVNGAKAASGSANDAALLGNKAQVGVKVADSGINDIEFSKKAIAAVSSDESTVQIVSDLVDMGKGSADALSEAANTLVAVKELITVNVGNATASAAVLANVKTMVQSVAAKAAAGQVTDIKASLGAMTSTVTAAKTDASFVANPTTLADSVASTPTAVVEDANEIIPVETTPTTPSTGGGGGGGTTTPTFTVTEGTGENDGVFTVGSSNGNITVTSDDTDYTFTPTTGTAVTVTVADVTSLVVNTITLTGDAAVLDGTTISGTGTVNVTALESTLDADLSEITATTVTAAIDTTGSTAESHMVFTDNLGNAKLILSGEGYLSYSGATIGTTASFEFSDAVTMTGTHTLLSGKTATGTAGTIILTALANDTDTSHFADTLTITAQVSSGTVNVSNNATLTGVDYFHVDTGAALTLTAAQLDASSTVGGAGSVTVLGSDGAQEINVSTTGTNSITAGLGLDTITLGHDGTDYTGTDTVVIGAAEAAQTETHALTFQDLSAGQSVTVDGLTLTATDAIAAADVAAGFASLTNAASAAGADVTNGEWSGAKSTAWTSGVAAGAVVTFTSETANTNVADIVVSSAGTAADSSTQRDIDLTDTEVVVGATYTVTIDDVNFDYVALDGNTLANIATGLATLINANESYTAANTDTNSVINITDGAGTLTIAVSATPPAPEAVTVADDTTAADIADSSTQRDIDLTDTEVVVGATYTVTIDDVNFDYVALDGNTLANIATGLATLINANESYTAANTDTNSVINITDGAGTLTIAVSATPPAPEAVTVADDTTAAD
ncbi:MAG: DUF4214 domain-containing protein, partial [Bacteroidales bacterium]|nr:DUF4214 domain-containing protein [Bacteroidales bacterium]